MAVGEIYQVKAIQEYLDVQVLNVFYYEQTTGVTDAALFAGGAVDTAIYQRWKEVANPLWQLDAIEVVNVARPSDFSYVDYTGYVGEREEDSNLASPRLAVQFKSARAYPGTRSARKRFAGVYTDDMAGKVWSFSLGVQATLTLIETALAAVLGSGVSYFKPVVVRHPVELGVAPVKRYDIVSYAYQAAVSTQNTRRA